MSSNYNSHLQSNNVDLQLILNTINTLPDAGLDLPELADEGAAEDLVVGKELINSAGNIVLGTNPYAKVETNSEVAIQADLLSQIASALEGKASGGEQATPIISVGSNGLITATAGNKSSTHQLAFQPAKTITPSTASQIAVSSGYYIGGNITVAAVPTQTKSVTPKSTAQNITPDSGKFLSKVTVNGDSNLVASNIKSGVSIFGVNGTLEAGSGSGGTVVDDVSKTLIAGIITEIRDDELESVRLYAFYNCYSLTTASFPAATTIGSHAFGNCYSLTTASFPAATSINPYTFYRCSSLTTASFPAATSIGSNAFYFCSRLTTASFPAATTIGSSAFYYCCRLSSLTLTASSVCTLSNSNAFNSTPYAGYKNYFSGTPYIYVPASLVQAYKTATNWTYFSSRFVAIDGDGNLISFTVDGTTYQAEVGMDWEAWVNSKYNSDNFTLDEDGWVCHPEFGYIVDDYFIEMTAGSRIVAGKNYYVS